MFKVYREGKPSSNVYLTLKDAGDGDIDLVAVDADGDRLSAGAILRMTPEGVIRRALSVSSELGFQLDGDGRVVLGKDF